MVRTFDIAPLRETSSQKRSGVARVCKWSNSLPAHRNQNEPYLPAFSFQQ